MALFRFRGQMLLLSYVLYISLLYIIHSLSGARRNLTIFVFLQKFLFLQMFYDMFSRQI